MTAAGVLPRAAQTPAAGRQAHPARLCGPPFVRGAAGMRRATARRACVKTGSARRLCAAAGPGRAEPTCNMTENYDI